MLHSLITYVDGFILTFRAPFHSFQTSAVAAAAAAKGLGVSIFGNNSGDLISTDIGNFNDDFLHLGLSFDDGPEPDDEDDDDVDEFGDYDEGDHNDNRDKDFGGTIGYSNYRTMSRSKTMGNLETDGSSGAGFVSYRDSYNFQSNNNAHAPNSPESPGERQQDADEIDSSRFMDTVSFAEFANFDNVNISDGFGDSFDAFSSSGQAFAAVLGQQGPSMGMGMSSSAQEVDCFADFEDVDFSQELGAGAGLGLGAVSGGVSPLEMDLLTAASADMAITVSSRSDLDM